MTARYDLWNLPRHGRLARFLRGPVRRRLSPFLQRRFHRRYAVTRRWRWRGLEIVIRPGIFPPGPTISTTVLLDHLSARGDGLRGLRAFDLGSGTGIVALALAHAGAVVTASDINPRAAANVAENAGLNGLSVGVVVADQFGGIDGSVFDLITITPPYYSANPTTAAELAWFCGRDFDYFRRLFPQLAILDLHRTDVLMMLSEDCDLERIAAIAAGHGLGLDLVHARRRWLEWKLLFRVVARDGAA
ncbi:class I SAM-dependent methyltransferase (plasmid) [Tistrella bauzanensis]|jgi:release factor glutamine methyltransferase|uniref:Class I SAM-dependent methyltransferase n=1 Tax=Tistrella arctica TaxID=3133430 RepID=A0ABU9YLL6_9PROT